MDQFRQGEFVPIHDTGDSRSACGLIGPSDCYLPVFRRVGIRSKKSRSTQTEHSTANETIHVEHDTILVA